MSERSERLLWALSEIDERKIDEASPEAGTRHPQWKKWGFASVAAAVLAVAIGIGSLILPRMGGTNGTASPGSGGGAANTAEGAPGGGGAGSDGAGAFMSYAGPVFPLTLREADGDISARREIAFDFAPWVPGGERYSTDVLVTDAYTLTNASEEEKTVSVLYPFSGSLYELAELMPGLRLDGAELDAVLHAGGYSGGFRNPEGGKSEPLLNLDQLSSWEGYRALLSGGRYQLSALETYPDLSDVPVTVYAFSDYYGPEPDADAGRPNPSIRAGFDLDYDRTTVLSYGFHGASFDRENGKMIQEFSIPEPHYPRYGQPFYLIVIGDDIQNLTTGGYVTGGTDPDTKMLDGAGVSVERYTSDLESALRAAAELMYAGNDRLRESGADFEQYFGLFKEQLRSYGFLSENPMERYNTTGWLEELNMDVCAVDRVFYLEAELTIPAGGRVELTAELRKKSSYDFYGGSSENRGVYGFDMATKLGSNLTFTEQTAALEDRGQIGIVRQNFGFDLENGVGRVTLDIEQEHYYLEVRGREDRFEQ